MDIGLFLFGIFGALLTVYLAKQDVIPEFRPLFDTSDKEKEKIEHTDHITETEKHIDDIQAKLEDKELPEGYPARLKIILDSSQSELKIERARLETIEREIKQSQLISRSLGFLIYIVLGGFFSSLLVGKVQVEGVSGELPQFFEAIVIGATWTSYLSTIGIRSGQNKVDGRIESGLKDSTKKIDEIRSELLKIVAEAKEKTKATKAEEVKLARSADLVERQMIEKLDLAKIELEKSWDFTRQTVQRDVRGIL